MGESGIRPFTDTNISTSELKPLRVMVVDDVLLVRKLVTASLESHNVQIVATAKNGQEAIEIANDIDVDVILLDIVMPVMQGPEALPIIRALCPNSAIIMLTSTSERNLVLKCKELGADGYVIKDNKMPGSLYKNIMMFLAKFKSKKGIE